VDLGYEVLTPPGEQSAIVTCRLGDVEKTTSLLREQNVVTTIRGADMRISPHFFNTEADIDGLFNVLETARAR
jgi:selenocysteine lyase/cysteine desulfurase